MKTNSTSVHVAVRPVAVTIFTLAAGRKVWGLWGIRANVATPKTQP